MRTIKKTGFFVSTAIVLVVCASAVSSQDTLADRRVVAAKIMTIVPMSQMLEDSFAQIAKQLPKDKRAGIIAKMKQNVRVDVVERIATDSMVKTFTTEELNALADFYGSKAGRSATQKFGIYMMGPIILPAIQAEIQRALKQQSNQK